MLLARDTELDGAARSGGSASCDAAQGVGEPAGDVS